MKKIVSILLSTIIFCSLFAVPLSVGAKTIDIESSSSADCEEGYRFVERSEEGYTKDGWFYRIIKEQNINTEKYKLFAIVGDYQGTATTVTLPTNISTKTGTYDILKYYGDILRNNSTVKKAVIPDNSTKIQIPDCIFRVSSTLEEVTIGSAVKSVYSAMFCDCTKLKTVNFTKEFLAQKPYIGEGAFARCTSLRNLVLPKGISTVSADALMGCKNLNTITFGEDIRSCPITTDNVNLTNIKLLRKKSDTGFYSVNPGNGNHNCPINFNNSEVTVECYEGTLAAYDIANYYPTKGIKFSFTFKSLGKVDGDPYVPPTTEPPTTTAPYTVSVGENDEWYLISSFNEWGNWNGSTVSDQSTKMTYNPSNNTFEKEVILNKGNYEFLVIANSAFNRHYFGLNGECSTNQEFSILTDTAKVKFVFDGIKVRMYINEQEVTSTTLPPTTTTTTTTASTTVPSTSASETASVPSTPTRPVMTVGSIDFTKSSDTLFVGKNNNYSYTYTCTDPINHINFVSDKNTVAQVTQNKDNTFTVVPLSKGKATITATLYDRDNREVTKSTFTVTVKQPVTKIIVKANNKTSLTNGKVFNVKKPNTKVQLNTTVGPTNANDKKVTYTSSNTSVATVNSKGLITTKKVGYTTITISSNDGNIKLNVKLTVGNTASKIAISPYKNISKVNSLTKINYSVYYGNKKANLYNIKPTWKSYKTSIATVDKNGNVTAKKKGICSIVATFNDGKSIYSKKCLVIVGNRVSKVVKTNYKKTITLKKNKSVTLKAEVKNNNATYKDCNWYLGKNKYVKISNVKNKGNKSHFYTQAKITAKKKGTCYVYCKTKDGSNKQLRYKIIIK